MADLGEFCSFAPTHVFDRDGRGTRVGCVNRIRKNSASRVMAVQDGKLAAAASIFSRRPAREWRIMGDLGEFCSLTPTQVLDEDGRVTGVGCIDGIRKNSASTVMAVQDGKLAAAAIHLRLAAASREWRIMADLAEYCLLTPTHVFDLDGRGTGVACIHGDGGSGWQVSRSRLHLRRAAASTGVANHG